MTALCLFGGVGRGGDCRSGEEGEERRESEKNGAGNGFCTLRFLQPAQASNTLIAQHTIVTRLHYPPTPKRVVTQACFEQLSSSATYHTLALSILFTIGFLDFNKVIQLP